MYYVVLVLVLVELLLVLLRTLFQNGKPGHLQLHYSGLPYKLTDDRLQLRLSLSNCFQVSIIILTLNPNSNL